MTILVIVNMLIDKVRLQNKNRTEIRKQIKDRQLEIQVTIHIRRQCTNSPFSLFLEKMEKMILMLLFFIIKYQKS